LVLLDDDDDVVVKEDDDDAMGSLAREMDVRGVVDVEKDILEVVGLRGFGGGTEVVWVEVRIIPGVCG